METIEKKNERSSNIELLRIICMLALVAHHLVVHGGSIALDGMPNNRIISLIILPVGKICFNCFVAISTWFLVKGRFQGVKFLKIWLETLFYNWVLMCVSALLQNGSGEPITFKNFFGACFPIIGNSHGYAASYLAFYLLVPFLQKLLVQLNQRQKVFIIVFLVITQICSGMMGAVIAYTQPLASEILLFVLCYAISDYLQQYPTQIQKKPLAMLGILVVLWGFTSFCRIMNGMNPEVWFYGYFANYVTGSEMSLVNIVAGYALFFLFYSITIHQSRCINRIATTTFGILLIHDHNYFRSILWNQLVKVPEWSTASTHVFIRNFVFATVVVFVLASIIDFTRQILVERWIMRLGVTKRVATSMEQWIV